MTTRRAPSPAVTTAAEAQGGEEMTVMPIEVLRITPDPTSEVPELNARGQRVIPEAILDLKFQGGAFRRLVSNVVVTPSDLSDATSNLYLSVGGVGGDPMFNHPCGYTGKLNVLTGLGHLVARPVPSDWDGPAE